jgi:DNA-binding LytR/AlgR family response regulator
VFAVSEDMPVPDEAKSEHAALVVLDPDAGERARVEGFAAQLERPVQAIAPGTLDPAALDALVDAAAIVVAWDLGGRAGLDWVAALARMRRGESPRLAIAAPIATRPMVVAAQRAGATAFLSHPYESDELALLCEGLA